ncbi:lipid-A-disaccharide synthase N-terminal domain-containing protein [Sphingobacterium bambusae]|uniref:Lipid-A-disaccharide synthase N-terminal domain-containing protein n=1 Tax=Sphingobacterium bambusae TaxID=662858 RepID=A0ABW6BFQ7_9SPHI|nr:lipid-A-disaccharide synthase N-terminal domain-containing protein [Sphingobacterium bambusae]WPL46950.1 lipid-A-disaccharide synthase N-terminal domain-containing protein [Sphingobacterium bambusae]
MEVNKWIIMAIGAIAQLLFSSRLIVQWISSEKSKKVLTPVLFWELSLLASFLLFCYGYLRDDFAIMLGQTLTYYIYIRNMSLQGEWKKIHRLMRLFIILFPVLLIVYGYNNNIYDLEKLFASAHIPRPLLLLGISSQTLFTCRFIYQWLYSESKKESLLPLGFWAISLAGSLLILLYAILREDVVLFCGHLLGSVVYSRNIILLRKNREQEG